MSKTENNILLFSITLCWSASYIFIKSLPPDLSSYAYLTMTTGIAALILLVVFWKQLKRLTKSTVLKGAVLSVILTLNLLLDKLGIDYLPSSNASFLSSLSILFVPMLLLMLHKRPSRNNVAGAAVILTGILLTKGFSIGGFYNIGTLFMLSSCLCASVYTIVVDKITKEEDPLLVGVVQMVFTAVIGFALWFLEEPTTFASLTYTNQMLSSIFVLAFFAKAYAYIVLMFSQKYSDPIRVTVIASTEPVVTLFLAVVIPAAYGAQESLNATAVVGAVLIMIGAVISGTDFLRNRKKGGVSHANQ